MPSLVTDKNPWPDGRGHLLTGKEGQAVHILDTAVRACSLYPGYYAAVDDFLTRMHKETSLKNFFKNVIGVDISAFLSYEYTSGWSSDKYATVLSAAKKSGTTLKSSPFATHNRICMADKAAGGPVDVKPFTYPTPKSQITVKSMTKKIKSGIKDLSAQHDIFLDRSMDYFTIKNIDFVLWQIPTVTKSSALEIYNAYTAASAKVTTACKNNSMYTAMWNFMSSWSKVVVYGGIKRSKDLATIHTNYRTILKAMTSSSYAGFMATGRNNLATICNNLCITSATLKSMNGCLNDMAVNIAGVSSVANLQTAATAKTATSAQKAVWNFYSAWSSVAPATLTKTTSTVVTYPTVSKLQAAFVPVTSHVLSATYAKYATTLCNLYGYLNTLTRSNATNKTRTSSINAAINTIVTELGSQMKAVQTSGNDCLSKYYKFLETRANTFDESHDEGKNMICWLYTHIPEILSDIDDFLGLSCEIDKSGNKHQRWRCYLNFFASGHSTTTKKNVDPGSEEPPSFNLNFTMPEDYYFTSTVTDDPKNAKGEYTGQSSRALLIDYTSEKTYSNSLLNIARSGGTWHNGITNLTSLQHEFVHALSFGNSFHGTGVSLMFSEGLADTLSQQISKLMSATGMSGGSWPKVIDKRGTLNVLTEDNGGTKQSYITLKLNQAASIIARTEDVTLAKGTQVFVPISKISSNLKGQTTNITFIQGDLLYDATKKIWYSILLDSKINVTIPKTLTATGSMIFPTIRPYCDYESFLYCPQRTGGITGFD